MTREVDGYDVNDALPSRTYCDVHGLLLRISTLFRGLAPRVAHRNERAHAAIFIPGSQMNFLCLQKVWLELLGDLLC